MRYNITDGDVSTFYINPKSGQIWLRRTVYQDRRDNYTLTVSASDQDKNEDTARITVSIVYLKLVIIRYYLPQTIINLILDAVKCIKTKVIIHISN